MIEKIVFLGKKDKFYTRLIIHLIPDAEVNERLRKAQENSKNKGRDNLTAEYIVGAHVNLFITNAQVDVIPTN
jgi:hypothetical protein